MLLTLHAGIASITQIPEIELTKEEGKELAAAVVNVSQYYPVAIDPKTQAWIGLVMVAGKMYGTRAYAYYLAKQTEGKPAPAPAASAAPFHAMNGGPATRGAEVLQ